MNEENKKVDADTLKSIDKKMFKMLESKFQEIDKAGDCGNTAKLAAVIFRLYRLEDLVNEDGRLNGQKP